MKRPMTRDVPPSPHTSQGARQPPAPGVEWVEHAVVAGGLASALSVVALMVRGRGDSGTATAPLNAPSHWLFGREALRSNRPSWRHTLSGLLIHHASSLFWGLMYSRLLHQQRSQAGIAQPAWGAVGITALAAWVDFRLVPDRLTPGFEHRLSRKSLLMVYGAFALGLALGGTRASKRQGRR